MSPVVHENKRHTSIKIDRTENTEKITVKIIFSVWQQNNTNRPKKEHKSKFKPVIYVTNILY